MGGMRLGSNHVWKYKTHKYRENHKGKFIQYQSKGRNSPAPYGSGMPTKSQLRWQIQGKFYTKRIGRNKWVRITTGIKRQGAFRLPGKRWINSKKRRKYYG